MTLYREVVRVVSVLAMLLAAPAWSMTTYQEALQRIATSRDADAARLDALFDAHWAYTMATYPEWATYVGYPGQNTHWTDNSLAAIARRKAEAESTLSAIESIPRTNLAGEQRISYDLFLKAAREAVEGAQYPQELLALNQLWGVQTDIADQMWAAPTNTLQDYRDRVERLRAAPELIASTQILLSSGIEKGITQPRIALAAVPDQILALMPPDPKDSPIYAPFADMSNEFPAEERASIQAEAREILQARVYPALKTLHQFIVARYLPACRDQISFASLPNGKDWYAFLVRNHTTTQLSPEDIHQLGLDEVARIRAEMETVKARAAFNGDLHAFNAFLKSDPRFFYSSAESLLGGYRDIAQRIEPQLPKLFGHLPRASYRIRAIPAYKAESAPAAYYQGGSLDTGRPGYFEVNTGNLQDSPRWEMEALTLHETMPGHHLQISVAQELRDLPEFRRQTGPTAFIEGWGLYAEGLGAELGLYQDPYSQFGQLSLEILRAMRLVVDTGIHAKGWSRDRVLDYMRENAPMGEQEIVNETDRYIADPGQALAYKIGELKMQDLRATAQAQLGDRFEIRAFHDQLLGSGALPLDVLESKMADWLKQQATEKVVASH